MHNIDRWDNILPSSVRPLDEDIFAISTIFTAQTRSPRLSKHLRITLNVPLQTQQNFALRSPIFNSNTNFKTSTRLYKEIRSHKTKNWGNHAHQPRRFAVSHASMREKVNFAQSRWYTNFPICSCKSNLDGKPSSMIGFTALLFKYKLLTAEF